MDPITSDSAANTTNLPVDAVEAGVQAILAKTPYFDSETHRELTTTQAFGLAIGDVKCILEAALATGTIILASDQEKLGQAHVAIQKTMESAWTQEVHKLRDREAQLEGRLADVTAQYQSLVAHLETRIAEAEQHKERLQEAIRKAKKLTDPDLEPYDQDARKHLLAMRDRTTEAWSLLAEALYE